LPGNIVAAWADFSSSAGLRFLEANTLCNTTSIWTPDDVDKIPIVNSQYAKSTMHVVKATHELISILAIAK
jgi:hypothetical protein